MIAAKLEMPNIPRFEIEKVPPCVSAPISVCLLALSKFQQGRTYKLRFHHKCDRCSITTNAIRDLSHAHTSVCPRRQHRSVHCGDLVFMGLELALARLGCQALDFLRDGSQALHVGIRDDGSDKPRRRRDRHRHVNVVVLTAPGNRGSSQAPVAAQAALRM